MKLAEARIFGPRQAYQLHYGATSQQADSCSASLPIPSQRQGTHFLSLLEYCQGTARREILTEQLAIFARHRCIGDISSPEIC